MCIIGDICNSIAKIGNSDQVTRTTTVYVAGFPAKTAAISQPGFFFNKGQVNARRQLGDKQGAIADYNSALKINPNYADAYNNRGNARADLGDKQGAIADFKKAAELYQQQGKKDDYQDALNRIRKLQ